MVVHAWSFQVWFIIEQKCLSSTYLLILHAERLLDRLNYTLLWDKSGLYWMEWMRSTFLKHIPVHTWGVPNFEPLSCMLGLYDVSKYSVSIMVSKTASKVRIIMLIFKKRWSFTDLFNCKWRGGFCFYLL